MDIEHLDIFPWSRGLETGIADIDAQHRQLVNSWVVRFFRVLL